MAKKTLTVYLATVDLSSGQGMKSGQSHCPEWAHNQRSAGIHVTEQRVVVGSEYEPVSERCSYCMKSAHLPV